MFVVGCENVIVVWLDDEKLAVLLGTEPVDQFAPVFQSPEVGLVSQAAS
jgi:hypothetical protein